MEEFAVCDEDGLQAFQPAKLSGIAVSAVEAELEELRIDFDAAAAMAAAALAAELQDLSDEADVWWPWGGMLGKQTGWREGRLNVVGFAIEQKCCDNVNLSHRFLRVD
jgi:hypothetical protein